MLEPSFCCYQAPAVGDIGPLPALQTGQITFGSLHKLAKLNAQVLDLWARLLHGLPGARLRMFRDTLGKWAQQYFRAEFERRGIKPDRIEMSCHLPGGGSHFDVYRQIDIALDVFPWSGHASACEALWMGVPVVTLNGSRHAGRMVATLLRTIGHPEWIAQTQDEYIKIASNLASNPAALAATRNGLRKQMAGSPLCDGARFTQQLEAAYRSMFHEA
jgi:predicted O-linked N-acetylglucosamine transferase (SPINDLY family)